MHLPNSDFFRSRLALLLFGIFAMLGLILPASASAQTSHIVTCSSDDMHMHTCMAGPNHGVRMVKQHSDSPCEMGRSYGVRGEQIWVDHGCRADFEVMNSSPGRDDRGRDDYRSDRDDHRDGGYEHARQAESRIVTCSSDNMRRNYCEIGPNRGVRLAKQRSDARCEMGRSFGVRGTQLWVDHGCRADFEVMGR